MKLFLTLLCILALSTQAFAKKGQFPSDPSGSPDRGGDRSPKGEVLDGHRSPSQPGRDVGLGNDRGTPNDGVDWGGRGGSESEFFQSLSEEQYLEKFALLRNTFSTVPQGIAEQIRENYDPEIGFWATLTAGAIGTFAFLRARSPVGRFATVAAGLFIANSASAKTQVNMDLFNIFDRNKISDDEALEIARSPEYSAGVKRALFIANETLCKQLGEQENVHILEFCFDAL